MADDYGEGIDPNAARREGESLSVRIDGDRDAPTRVLALSRARDGVVNVQEFRAGCAPMEYTATVDELLALFALAHRERRGMSESLYGIRLWLDG